MRAMTCRLSARGTRGLGLLVLCAAALGVAWADDADPAGRAARLSDAEGAVSLQPAGMREWTAATLNRPLTTGDRLWSDQSSRAELDLGTAAVRLGSDTGFALLNLDDHSAQMQLGAGTLIVSVRELAGGESYEVDTPNIALSLQQPGVYRLEVNDAGTATAVAVSQGAAQASGGGQTIAIAAQQVVIFSGADPLAWQSSTLGPPDDFDNWSAERERELAESASAGFVPSDVPGVQDLDSNGQWQQTPEYGYVWVPSAVAVGWVPYRYGHWVWITPWGWTWVDDAPWGYAPFHYGRWVAWNNSWCWVPAPRHGHQGRTVYAPALVAWVGGSAPRAVALGSVGWFPLGPREVYVPAYRASATYLRNVNITNTTVINNTYLSNAYQGNLPQRYVNDTPGAVTAVSPSTFTSGRSVGTRVLELPPAALGAAAVTAAAPAIVPLRQSVLGAGESRAVPRPPATLLQRPVVARTAPPAAPAPFERQFAAMQAKGGRPLTRSELAALQPASPLAPVRVVSSRGAPIAAGAGTHVSGASRAAGTAAPSSRAPTHTQGENIPSLAERERALQQSALPSESPRARISEKDATGTRVYAPATTEPSYSTQVLRSDRPVAAPQPAASAPQPAASAPASAPQRSAAPDDPAHAHDRPASLPVYHFPSGGESPAHPTTAVHPQQTPAAVVAPSAAHAPAASPPVAHPPPPPNAQSSSKEPRDSAPHGDRDSRERVLR